MNNEYLVNEFLDGTLSQAEEDNFFNLLSGESDLRSELKSQLAIKNAVKSDLSAYTPRSESTYTIFNKLDLYPPVPITNPAAIFSDKIVSFVKAKSGYILSGLISAAATALLMFLWFDQQEGNDLYPNRNNTAVYNSDDQFEKQNLAKHNEKFNSNPESVENLNQIQKQESPKEIIKYVYIEKKSSKVSENSLNNKLNEITAENDLNSFNQNSSDLSHSKEISLSSKPDLYFGSSQKMSNDNIIFTAGGFENNISADKFLSFEIRRGNYYHGTSSQAKSKNSAAFLDIGVSLLYKLSKQLSLGIDYQNEQYVQKFSGVEDGVVYDYEQIPNFNTFSLILHYMPEFLQVDNLLKPYIQTAVGANESGPSGRLGLGLEFYLVENIFIKAGTEYNVLLFKQGKSAFISDKTGFHFGLGLDF